MTGPRPTSAEIRSHATFRAILLALSYPGRSQWLSEQAQSPFALIAESLVDLETTWFADDPSLRDILMHTGGRARPVDEAHYQFYPTLDAAQLRDLSNAPVGTPLYPDEGATLVIGCVLDRGQSLRLRGPGIPSMREVRVDGIPSGFWTLRAQTCLFPLGWDVFLVDGQQVVGLPRTTQIEVR